jgi:uncharacterized protein (TIRG00374 family)
MRRNWSIGAAQAAVTVVLLALLLRGFDVGAFGHAIVRVPVSYYLMSLAVLAAGQVLYALRWQMVLRGMGLRVPFRAVMEPYLVGIFFNNFLPSAVGGDVARVYYMGRRAGFAASATSVVVDRALGLGWIAVLATVLLWTLPLPGEAFDVARRVLVLILVGLGVLVVASSQLEGVAGRWGRWPSRVRTIAASLRGHLAALWRAPLIVVRVLAIVVAYFAALTWVYRTYFRLAGGHDVSFPLVFATLLTIAVLSNVPLTVNGIGLREQLHYVLFSVFGLSKEETVAASVVVFSQLLIVSLAGCILWLRLRGRASMTRVAATR